MTASGAMIMSDELYWIPGQARNDGVGSHDYRVKPGMTALGVTIMSEPLQTVAINVTVNGKTHQRNVEPRQLLVEFIREELRLTGTHIGCDTSYCGACTVLLDGTAIKSCTLFAVQADGAEVTTVEALEKEGQLHPLQQAFSEQHGLQCGYCTPGMLMSSVALLAENPEPDVQDIRNALSGNVCRCTGYQNIIKSVQAAATVLARNSHQVMR